ncbi:MAG: hypothetical protein ACR2GG_06190 [Gemmatimonadaceae bacterium]
MRPYSWMGYFDACVQPFRPDALGRRVIVPFRWSGPVYLVPDNDAERVRRGLKQLLASISAFRLT